MGSITRVKFSSGDLEALAIFISGYQETLKYPEAFPEHTPRYNALLDQIKLKCHFVAHSSFTLLLTSFELMALDVALEGFIRLIERSIPAGKREKIIAPIDLFRQQLAVKLSHEEVGLYYSL